MKNIIRTYTWLIILLSLHYLGQAHATQHEQQGWWHEPLVELYYKGTLKVNRKETKAMIQAFDDLHDTHVKSIQDIDSKIEPKMLNKGKFSSNKYELDVFTVFYLFKKIDSSTPLIQQEIQRGYQALTKLYYKGTSTAKKDQIPIQQILTQKNTTKNTKPSKHQSYAFDLATYLTNHTTLPNQQYQPLPITVQQAPRYSNHHNNITTQFHNLKTTMRKSPSQIALLHIDSLDRVPSLEVHTSDEEESEEDTKDDHNTHTSSPTITNNNHDRHLQQVIQETKVHENRLENSLKKLKQLDKQLTTHSINKHHQSSLPCSHTNPEPHTSAPFTTPKNTLHHTPIPSLHDIHSEVLNQVHQKHKTSLKQLKEADQALEHKQQIIVRMQQKIKNLQQDANQDKATIQHLKDTIKGLQQKATQRTTTSPNILTHVLALVVGTIVGIAIDRYMLKAKHQENADQSVADKEASSGVNKTTGR